MKKSPNIVNRDLFKDTDLNLKELKINQVENIEKKCMDSVIINTSNISDIFYQNEISNNSFNKCNESYNDSITKSLDGSVKYKINYDTKSSSQNKNQSKINFFNNTQLLD